MKILFFWYHQASSQWGACNPVTWSESSCEWIGKKMVTFPWNVSYLQYTYLVFNKYFYGEATLYIWVRTLHSAIAGLLLFRLLLIHNFTILALYYFTHAFYTAVFHFHIVLVKEASVLMMKWEMFFEQDSWTFYRYFLFTLALNGELNHSNFLLRFLFLWCVSLYIILSI